MDFLLFLILRLMIIKQDDHCFLEHKKALISKCFNLIYKIYFQIAYKLKI